MAGRWELTDEQWELIEPILRPARRKDNRGRPRHDKLPPIGHALGIIHRKLPWLRAAGMLAHAAKAFMRWVLDQRTRPDTNLGPIGCRRGSDNASCSGLLRSKLANPAFISRLLTEGLIESDLSSTPRSQIHRPLRCCRFWCRLSRRQFRPTWKIRATRQRDRWKRIPGQYVLHPRQD
jgi:transposase